MTRREGKESAVEVARGAQSQRAVFGPLWMSRNNTPTMWRSEPESDSVGVKPGVAALSFGERLDKQSSLHCALDRYDRSNM